MCSRALFSWDVTLCKAAETKSEGLRRGLWFSTSRGHSTNFVFWRFLISSLFPFKTGPDLKQLLEKWSGQVTSYRGISPCWLVPRTSQIRGELSWVLLFRLLPSKVVLIRPGLLTIGGPKNATKSGQWNYSRNKKMWQISSVALFWLMFTAAPDIAGTNWNCW